MRANKDAAIIAADDTFIGFLRDTWGINSNYIDYQRSNMYGNQIIYLTMDTAHGEVNHNIQKGITNRCVSGRDPRQPKGQQVLW